MDRDFWRTRRSIVGFNFWNDSYDDPWRDRYYSYYNPSYYQAYSYYPYPSYASYPVYNYYYQPVASAFYTFGFPVSYYDAFYPSYSYYDPYYASYYDPYYSSYYDPYYASYYDPYYGYDYDWKTSLIRTVVSLFIGGGSGVYYDDPYYAYNPYNYASYYPSYVEDPQYYYSSYPYSNAAYVPQYGVYSAPAYRDYSYMPSYNAYPNGYYDPYAYANQNDPYGGLFGLENGDLTSTLIRRALGMGYYQGFLEGQAARQQGWGDEYYSDPYQYYSFNGGYVDTYYDPYSSSLGDTRRVYSEGYEQGYRDALAGRTELYEEFDDTSNVDLVSLLVGSGLTLRN